MVPVAQFGNWSENECHHKRFKLALITSSVKQNTCKSFISLSIYIKYIICNIYINKTVSCSITIGRSLRTDKGRRYSYFLSERYFKDDHCFLFLFLTTLLIISSQWNGSKAMFSSGRTTMAFETVCWIETSGRGKR